MQATKKKLMWMPGSVLVCSATRMWTLESAKWPDMNQPATNAPIAKNAT